MPVRRRDPVVTSGPLISTSKSILQWVFPFACLIGILLEVGRSRFHSFTVALFRGVILGIG